MSISQAPELRRYRVALVEMSDHVYDRVNLTKTCIAETNRWGHHA
jgi:hypothetical protein